MVRVPFLLLRKFGRLLLQMSGGHPSLNGFCLAFDRYCLRQREDLNENTWSMLWQWVHQQALIQLSLSLFLRKPLLME